MRGLIDISDAMRRECRSRGADWGIAVLADAQHGIVTRPQLVALSIHPRAIDRRIAAGRLHVLHAGVYAVGDRALPSLGRLAGAVCAAGEGAAAGRRSAAALHGLRTYEGKPEVIARPGTRNHDGIRICRTLLAPDEVTVARGIPTTTVARTLLDLGGVDKTLAEKALREAEFLRLFDLHEVSRLLERYPRRPGTARLRRVIATYVDSENRTRSDMEERFRSVVLGANLPTPELNGTLELGALTIEADAIWRDAKLIVELDGRQAHLTPHAFETDRERDRVAALHGWRVVRLTWRQLAKQHRRLVADLRSLLSTR
jgi:very-short-patch-repair endonuclease